MITHSVTQYTWSCCRKRIEIPHSVLGSALFWFLKSILKKSTVSLCWCFNKAQWTTITEAGFMQAFTAVVVRIKKIWRFRLDYYASGELQWAVHTDTPFDREKRQHRPTYRRPWHDSCIAANFSHSRYHILHNLLQSNNQINMWAQCP